MAPGPTDYQTLTIAANPFRKSITLINSTLPYRYYDPESYLTSPGSEDGSLIYTDQATADKYDNWYLLAYQPDFGRFIQLGDILPPGATRTLETTTAIAIRPTHAAAPNDDYYDFMPRVSWTEETYA